MREAVTLYESPCRPCRKRESPHAARDAGLAGREARSIGSSAMGDGSTRPRLEARPEPSRSAAPPGLSRHGNDQAVTSPFRAHFRASRLRTCRGCGCTDDDCSGCIRRTGYPCWWVEADLCSACEPEDLVA